MSASSSMLAGQIAIVTGASAGLGQRFARLLAQNGATVAAAGRRLDRLQALADSVVDGEGRIVPLQMDVSDADSIDAGLAWVTSNLGTPTILVNNAGIPDAKRAHKMPLELVDAVIDTNLRGPFLLSGAFARALIEEGTPGRIVNISSMGAFHYGGAGAALYSITKAAINRMTEVLAVEWATHSINVNAIAPGAFSTEMMDGMIARVGDPSGSFPRKRMGDPERLDSTMLYLLSPESDYVTGTVVKVDDGQSPR